MHFSFPGEYISAEKIVHVSIDDCVESLQKLTMPDVNSIFEVAFFNQLFEFHRQYGSKITCYVYARKDDFDLSLVPDRFKKEFEASCNWLKFAYHSSHFDIEKAKLENENEFSQSFFWANTQIDRFAGKCARAQILRLDYFFAKSGWISSIVEGGTKYLLAPDMGGRKAYALSKEESQLVFKKGFLPFDSNQPSRGGYWRTDLRYENIFWIRWALEKLRDQKRIVVFTHEWAMDRQVRARMETSFKWFNKHGYKFIL